MSRSEQAIEQEIQAKNLNAPRLTPAVIDAAIVSKAFYVFPGTTVTVCCLTLVNGFNAVGYSAAASIENFDIEIGQKIAFENAKFHLFFWWLYFEQWYNLFVV